VGAAALRELIMLVGGVAMAWPLAGRAQAASMPVMGFMSARSPEDSVNKGLKDEGGSSAHQGAREID